MSSITLRVDDDIIRKVRKIAIDKNTTLTAMVREFLRSVSERDETSRERAARRLERTFKTSSRNMGPRKWSREELHER